MDNVDTGTIRMALQIGGMLVGGGVMWGWVKFGIAPRVVECMKRMDKFEDSKGEALAQVEERLVKKIEGVHRHIDEDTASIRNNIGVLFGKLDRSVEATGDTKIVLTYMASKVGNPGNDKELIDLIRDIGKKKNGR